VAGSWFGLLIIAVALGIAGATLSSLEESVPLLSSRAGGVGMASIQRIVSPLTKGISYSVHAERA
jgi:hypothetical protein